MNKVRIGCAALAAALALTACKGDPGDQAVAGFTELPRGEAAEAARDLADLGIEDAIARTREVAELGGLRIATRRELLGHAFDMRRKSTQMRLDSEEFAQMLLSLGFPFGNAGGLGVDRDNSMLQSLGREDLQEVRRDAEQARYAAQTALKTEDDAARAEHRRRVKAVVDLSEARFAAARAAEVELSRARSAAPREERSAFDARMAVARQERSDAREAVTAARAEARVLEEAFREAQRWSPARLEKEAAHHVGRNPEAGRQLMQLLAAWVQAAAQDPRHPDSFVPLYLAEMARRQADPIDLAAAPAADRHRWSLLEMALFVAAFQPVREPLPAAAPGPVVTLLKTLVPPAHAGSPCEVAREAWGSWGGVAGSANAEAGNRLLGLEFKRLWGKEAAKKIGDAISATAIVGKVISLAAFHAHNQVTVEADIAQMHKPLGSHRRVTFTARAGVTPEELDAYENAVKGTGLHDQSVRDCLGWAGLPSSDSIRDVARDAQNWILDWQLQGKGQHANWSPRDNRDAKFFGHGRVGKPMKRVSPSSAESSFVIRVLPEGAHAGPVSGSQVVVRAEVDSSGMPSLGTLVNVGKTALGLAESVVDIAAGWTRVVFKPKAYAVIDLEFHCPNPTTIHRYVTNPVAWGGGDGGEGCTFHFDTREEFEEWREGHGM